MIALRRLAAVRVAVAVGALAAVGLFAGAVRVTPWLLDPSVPCRVAAPFARTLASVAFESALLVGWPVGWALAAFRLTESGEARVLQLLGERPGTTVARLGRQGVWLAGGLALVAWAVGRDAGAPGRVATELVAQSRAACAAATVPKTYSIPFTDWTWLCAPGRAPRLVGSPPSGMGSVVVSASGARISGDLRALELDDPRVFVETKPAVSVHAGSMSVRGLTGWAQSSALPEPLRAFALASSAGLSGALAVYLILRACAPTRIGAMALGAAGPIASLGFLRFLERSSARLWVSACMPVAGGLATLVCAALLASLSPEKLWRALSGRSLRTRASAATH